MKHLFFFAAAQTPTQEQVLARMARMQRQGATVTVPVGPVAFADAVRDLCQQVGQTKFAVAPGIKGSVRGDGGQAAFFQTLARLGRQTKPVSYPVWDGETLRLVAAPAPGKYDAAHRLYRLQGVAQPIVFGEPDGMAFGTDNLLDDGILYLAAGSGIAVTVTVRDEDRPETPPRGLTVVRETHGKVERFALDGKGKARVPATKAASYLYVPARGPWTLVSAGLGASDGKGDASFAFRRNPSGK